jgi:hypothetical protein
LSLWVTLSARSHDGAVKGQESTFPDPRAEIAATCSAPCSFNIQDQA